MIRYARPSDHPAIAAVVTAAFGRPDEAALATRLRADEDTLFEMVAEEDGEVVGHVLFSRLWVDRFELYGALAPLAVRPDRQGQGLGGKLVRAGLEGAIPPITTGSAFRRRPRGTLTRLTAASRRSRLWRWRKTPSKGP